MKEFKTRPISFFFFPDPSLNLALVYYSKLPAMESECPQTCPIFATQGDSGHMVS